MTLAFAIDAVTERAMLAKFMFTGRDYIRFLRHARRRPECNRK
jgi:hypothetical protein